MTLLLTIITAVICTIIWYTNKSARDVKVGTLCYMFWGASIMWLVDAIFEYLEMGTEYFNPSMADILNDFYLGFSVIAFGLVIWIVSLLIKDPKKIIHNLTNKR